MAKEAPEKKDPEGSGFDPGGLGLAIGTSVLGPLVAKGIGSLFGLDEPSEAERMAAAQREDAIRRLREQAEGRTASAAELQARQQQQRTVQALSSLAARGTAQQQAGAQRAAMQAAPEIMAQQGATAAAARAAEMERARNALAQTQMMSAQQGAAQGMADRQYMQRLIGAGVQGAAGIVGQAALQSPKNEKKKPKTPGEPEQPGGGGGGGMETGTSSQGMTASPVDRTVVNVPSTMLQTGAAPVQAQPGSMQTRPQLMPQVGYQAPGVSLGTSQMQLKPPGMQLGSRARASLYGGTDPLDGQYKLGGGY